ncbi:conserved membrane hypothetical protein [Rubrivivax sp. A210]|uniref:BPSS1780 family membrane protein n=1 Tax=Rubrivivax sp. A210 TaxID=2772301 RepID=UPI001917A866|nr:BPSS1780 family membrane protein [Rubrivivax sp. A210]CAD5373777.1 conserved membrane hypothetical protein [Rubrivivax sp. A210]
MALLLKTVAAARGPRWIGDAFRLFARRPMAFTSLFAVFLGAALLVSLVPVLGALVQMMALPLLSLGFMVAARSALEGGPVSPRQFIEPLQADPARRRALLLLCVGYGVAALFILLLADAVSNSAWGRLQTLMARGQEAQAEIDALLAEPGVSAALLLAGTLGTALSVPYWHAPALVYWGGQSAGQALFSSTLAVWRARGAFFGYMLGWVGVVLVFGFVTAFVFGLLGLPQLAGILGVPGGLVFSAVFYISLLFTFNDSFGGATAAADPEINRPA